MCVEQGKQLPESAAMQIISKFWAPRMASQVSDVKCMSDGTGICFDVRTNDADNFLENYTHLKAT